MGRGHPEPHVDRAIARAAIQGAEDGFGRTGTAAGPGARRGEAVLRIAARDADPVGRPEAVDRRVDAEDETAERMVESGTVLIPAVVPEVAKTFAPGRIDGRRRGGPGRQGGEAIDEGRLVFGAFIC